MPQASDELRAKFPGSIEEALAVLDPFCIERSGLIRPRSQEHRDRMTAREHDAIDYAFEEWDYAYDPAPWPVRP